MCVCVCVWCVCECECVCVWFVHCCWKLLEVVGLLFSSLLLVYDKCIDMMCIVVVSLSSSGLLAAFSLFDSTFSSSLCLIHSVFSFGFLIFMSPFPCSNLIKCNDLSLS